MPFIIFFLGISVGSFINCAAYRMHRGKSIHGRSFCDNCGHSLSFLDLIPLLSYLFLRGRCRYCGKRFSAEHFFVELFTGLLFLSFYSPIFSVFNLLHLLYFLIIASFLAFIFVYDFRHYIIPDIAVYSLIALSFLYRLLFSFLEKDGDIFFYSFASALGAFLFFFSIFYISKGKWMGFGDVKYVIFMGFFLGFPNIIVGLFLSFLIGAIIGTVLLCLQKKGLRSEIPFGPFLIIGTLTAHFFGEQLVSLYLSCLL